MFEKIRAEYRSTLKSSDTEEHIDLAFYRPIGFAWACFFRRLGIHPNVVTVISMFLGVGAGICFYFTNIWITLLGMLLLIWANSYDSADGQLARLTGQYSKLGRILDGAAGDIWFIAIYAAICLRSVHTVPFFSEHPWVIWVVAATAGFCHAQQAAAADYYRQAHLFFLKGRSGSELDSSEAIRSRLEASRRKGLWFQSLVDWFYLGYTQRQEKSTPQFQRLRDVLRRVNPDSECYRTICREFLPLSLPLCKWENFMTFNWRCITLFICLLAGVPWVYFIVELTVFNIVLLYTRYRHEKICRIVLAGSSAKCGSLVAE